MRLKKERYQRSVKLRKEQGYKENVNNLSDMCQMKAVASVKKVLSLNKCTELWMMLKVSHDEQIHHKEMFSHSVIPA